MRLAILADIHGNLHALEAVLADVERQHVDLMVVNGDLVNRGPNNLEVMARLQGLGLAATLGNHDDLMRKWVARDPDLPNSWFGDPFWEGTAWCASQLARGGWIDTLAAMPLTHRIALDGAPSVLISHGSPRHYREGYGHFLTDEIISEIVQMHPADVLVGSHTHRPMERRWGGHLILNSGAVGAPFNGDPHAQYLLLTLEEQSWLPEFRRVPYDREGALQAFHELNFLEEGGLSAHIFYLELEFARSFLTPFFMWTEERGEAQTWERWEAFKVAFGERFREGYSGSHNE